MTLAAPQGESTSSGASPALGGDIAPNASLTTPDVHLYISGSDGKHPSDPATRPVPNAIQGSWFSVGLILQGNDASDYYITNYTYTFPSVALNGYGTFITMHERPGDPTDTGEYKAFNGDPGGTAEVVAVTADDLSRDVNEQNDHVASGFYIGPMTSDNQTITVSAVATAVNRIDHSTLTLDDRETVNVRRPDPLIFIASFGVAGINANAGSEWLRLPEDFPTNAGIEYQAQLDDYHLGDLGDPQFGGQSSSFAMSQTMTYSSVRSYDRPIPFAPVDQIDGQVANGSGGFTDPGVILDSFPYGGHIESPGTALTAEDSPGSPLETPGTYQAANNEADIPKSKAREDVFVTTLMYKPVGGIWIPVQNFTWKWNASAEYDAVAMQWNLTAADQTAPGAPSNTTDFPVWQHTFTEVADHWRDKP